MKNMEKINVTCVNDPSKGEVTKTTLTRRVKNRKTYPKKKLDLIQIICIIYISVIITSIFIDIYLPVFIIGWTFVIAITLITIGLLIEIILDIKDTYKYKR